MSDVFMSYAREDLPVAQALADALESMGWSVWWDRSIPAGSEFSSVIEDELAAARCVIVLWSRSAVASQFVRDEAGVASARGVLIPVRIEDVQPPLGFRQIQTADLLGWRGDARTPGFDQIVDAVERFTRASASNAPAFTGRIAPARRRLRRVLGWALAALLALAAVYALVVEMPRWLDSDSEMVLLPGGVFMMGSRELEAREALASHHGATLAEREQPRHRVHLDPFYIDRFEVTVGEYRRCAACQPLSEAAQSVLETAEASHPVRGVSWHEASRYCHSVGKVLPTEAQWEYAARGGEAREYPWQSGPVNGLRANYCDVRCEGGAPSEDDGFAETAPVGSFEAGTSRHGVHDLAGNVAEWVRDAYDARFYERSDGANPVNTIPHQDGYRVVRGGSYADEPYFLRAATRNFRPEHASDSKIGFRCARPRE